MRTAGLRGGGCVLLALLLQGALALLFPAALPPVLLPGVICLLGLRLGPAAGAGLGVWAGLLWAAGGHGFAALALLPALGGFTASLASGGTETLLRRWLLCLPGLALYALLSYLVHLWGGNGVLVMLRTLLLSLVCLPLAQGLCALCFLRPRRHRRRRSIPAKNLGT